MVRSGIVTAVGVMAALTWRLPSMRVTIGTLLSCGGSCWWASSAPAAASAPVAPSASLLSTATCWLLGLLLSGGGCGGNWHHNGRYNLRSESASTK